MSTTTVLAIETSCDETAIAIVKKNSEGLVVKSNLVSSQVKLHAEWGGVVPNLAAREHLENIGNIFERTLAESGKTKADLDLIAVTNGPGLIPALMIGTNFAKTLSYLWNKPLVGIHHIEGHIYANFVRGIENCELEIMNGIQNSKSKIQDPSCIFPALCLVVSGGHTQLVFMKNHLSYEIIGQTLDDAAGEAFDKVARILAIGYPGGPAVSACAEKFEILNSKFETNSNDKTNNGRIKFPRPLLNRADFDFSFSGLKTAVLYETKKNPELLKDNGYISEVCHEFQQAAVDVLVTKTIKAAEKFQPKTIMLAGGVSANKKLREQLGAAIEYSLPDVSYHVPDLNLTGDNAAMIAVAAAFRWEKMSDAEKKEAENSWKTLQADANLKLA